jgi:two-component system nitrate/nitrite response regulator NarL
MDNPILTILIVPRALVREGLASLLASTNYKPDLSLSQIGELGPELVHCNKTVLFIISRDALKGTRDAVLPDLELLRQEYPDSRMLLLSDVFNLADVVAAVRAGANGYLMNTLSAGALVKSLDLVMLGETVLTSEFAHAVSDSRGKNNEIPSWTLPPPALLAPEQPDLDWNALEPPAGHHLSSRETAILARLIRGDSNKHIARSIGVAEATVKTHIKAILRKIRVKNRTQAAMWAYTNLPEAVEIDITPPLPLSSGTNGIVRQ